jgi:amino acid transporter
MDLEVEDFLGELRLGKRLTTIGQVSTRGLVVFLGLSLLVTSRTLILIGPLAAIASLLAFLVLGLTLLNLLELLGGSGERGGTYNLIHETLERLGGFFAGWFLLAGNIVLAAALMGSAGDHLVTLFPGSERITPYLSLGLLAAIVIIQLFRLLPRRELLWPVFLILIVALVVLYLDSLQAVGL